MGVIRILQEKVASQIAAGEVIERPASVVRELIDNSVDAGADRISIEIEKGGKGSIRVRDNGAGMSRDDLLLSIERHATSKINTVSDLFSIKTLGFRGEALPSIMAVSRAEITSRQKDLLIGHRLKVTGGKLISIDETGSPPGTLVVVQDLFFNIPARRKFLRGMKTETEHIIDILSRISLPLKHIHFILKDTGKTVLNLPASDKDLNRISELMGRQVAGSMQYAHAESDGLMIQAYLASPDLSRSRGDRIYICVNGRNIRDKLISRAIIEGYGQRLMKGRYPQAILFITVDPASVDVNVHPTKQEIRFHQPELVYRTILSTVEKVMKDSRSHAVFQPVYRVEEGFETGKTIMTAEPLKEYSKPDMQVPLEQRSDFQEELLRERPHIIGCVKETYILCETRDGLLLIDQHAAHERIVYETLKKAHQSIPLERQTFLIPYKLELSLRDGRTLEKAIDLLKNLGLELEHFGGSTFLLRAVPSILLNIDWQKFMIDLIPLLDEGGDLNNKKALDKILTMMACHGAIRAGTRMSREEITTLLNQLDRTNLPTHCPHGRPIAHLFRFSEIEKMFKRIV